MRAIRLPPLFFFWFLVSSVFAGEVHRAAAPVSDWDGIISSTIFSDIADFELDIEQGANERVYAFFAMDEAGELSLSVAVAIAPVGSRLSVVDLQADIAAADPATRTRDFPDISAGARASDTRFGPDGVLSGVIFGTSDGFFDVVVSVLEASGSSERSPLSVEKAARRIDVAYDATRL